MLNQEKIEGIIELLNEKNNHLKIYLDISEKERKSFKARNFDNIEELYRVREDLLETIRKIDQKIETSTGEVLPNDLSSHDRLCIKQILKNKESLVSQIVEHDLVILSCVENEKSSIIKKIMSLRNGRKILKAYKTLPDIID